MTDHEHIQHTIALLERRRADIDAAIVALNRLPVTLAVVDVRPTQELDRPTNPGRFPPVVGPNDGSAAPTSEAARPATSDDRARPVERSPEPVVPGAAGTVELEASPGPREPARRKPRRTLATASGQPVSDRFGKLAPKTRDAVWLALKNAQKFVEGRPAGVEGLDTIAIRAAVALRLGLAKRDATTSELKGAVANACQLLKRDGYVRRTPGGWWMLTETPRTLEAPEPVPAPEETTTHDDDE